MSDGMSKLARMRAKLKETAGGTGGPRDNSGFPFWNTTAENPTSLRFLPDKDENNDFFWRERMQFRWEFPDLKNPGNKVKITMPCIEQWEGRGTCPVLAEIRPFWKADKESEEYKTAQKVNVKRDFIYQGFVRRTAIKEDSPPENPIRKFYMAKEIHNKIREAVTSEDPDTSFDHSPDDYVNGRDYVIKVTKNARNYNDYSTSSFSNKITALTDHELAMIEKYGLWDLTAALGQRPSEEAFELQLEMMEAFIDGKPWDPAWEKHWKPWRPDGKQDDGAAKTNSRQIPQEDTEKSETKTTSAISASTLERMKARKSTPPKEETVDESVDDDDRVETVTAAKVDPVQPTKDTRSALEKLKARRSAAPPPRDDLDEDSIPY